MKIKTLKDIKTVEEQLLSNLVGKQRMAYFNLVVDEGDGAISNCYMSPASPLSRGKSFLGVQDYATLMVLLFTHPKVKDLEYDEKNNMVCAMFEAPEVGEMKENEENEF